MIERKKIETEQSIEFEKSGEMISVRIKLENISPKTNNSSLIQQLEVLYQNLIKDIFT
ncbi:MAG: hypothetical protein KH355_02935 [Clostridiales bacterium]|nr:hypothetical protein [Clostridiales bacterium]